MYIHLNSVPKAGGRKPLTQSVENTLGPPNGGPMGGPLGGPLGRPLGGPSLRKPLDAAGAT